MQRGIKMISERGIDYPEVKYTEPLTEQHIIERLRQIRSIE